MAKYGDVFKARQKEKEGKVSRDLEIQKYGIEEKKEKQVNLGIKIAESRRRHWVGQAKLKGITISEIIIETLSKKFGEPE